MNVFLVNAHPETDSFNGSLAASAAAALRESGHDVVVSHLYDEGFDPVERGAHYRPRANANVFVPLEEQRAAWKNGTVPEFVTREISRLENCDLLLLQFPMWWHSVPAILKGWFDRVFLSGGLYTGRMRYDNGYFLGRRAVVSLTTGAPEQAFGPHSRAGDLGAMLYPIQYSLYYMGFDVLRPNIVHGVQGGGYSYQGQDALEEHLKQALADWKQRVAGLFSEAPLTFPGWDDWDESGGPKAEKQFSGTVRAPS